MEPTDTNTNAADNTTATTATNDTETKDAQEVDTRPLSRWLADKLGL